MKKLFWTFLVSVISLSLSSQAYDILSYDVNVNISKEGHYDISETIVVFFNEKRRGIFRNIPKKYKVNGKTQKIQLSEVRVADHKAKILNEGNDKVIRIGDKDTYLTGEQTYRLSYRINHGFIHDEDHTAFQYNLIHDWDTDIKKLTYKIGIPHDAVLFAKDYNIMTGAMGEQNKHVSIELDGNYISGRSLTPIPAQESVTVAIRFPVGFILKKEHPHSWEVIKKKKGWMAPVAGLALLLGTFFSSRRRKVASDPISDRYYPPEGFSPALVGAYHDHKVHTEDIISLLPYWADKGHIKILNGGNLLYFKKLNDLHSTAPEYQTTMFDAIFGLDEMVVLQELKEKIYKKLGSAKKSLDQQVLQRELYDHKEWNIFHSGKMLVIGIGSILASIVFGIVLQDFLAVAALILLGIGCIIIHNTKPKLSQKGIDLKNHLIGLKNHLLNGDPDQIAALIKKNPKYFEQVFPYAIALGVDQTWINKIKEMDIPEPHWYDRHESYPDDGRAYSKGNISEVSKAFNVPEIASVFQSHPKPEPGSHSSGGGFSGGGAGGGFGGGGGAW